ncbi:hypothetical protein A2673_04005 [Candidatus Kaiserbacteria bacterium RIFCSPHIGHO2_01_FULL_50_13]|uniref:SHSP domain-containing protein n=1 Tax=Candidatus Kaiserbacteria bacterium RIFCSPLOWO2_01_FULL_50_24 TaxID=1798507 RepID=A0A1F6EP73_9BACT|nr:MAG: hypothetical protein A2673_04005 [Candidatus Kaiserbacteria bacterium RIFCSPHIGHO2_01_FULL_50_13]OGG75162.1 MAG: hypothetical protein A3A34_02305 [Candidatus Kaiserbacteria bacterium RIFCSPLOWO2_01_FULL_50_24]OGG81048.1 MAG: hypothetical protein A3H74_00935 [Candidatus Kaiserbacteria bacterium RIFCSPLOWO2_02_FULL_51_13]
MSFLKPSFFTRLLGSDEYEEGGTPIPFEGGGDERHSHAHIAAREDNAFPEEAGELAVDIYQTQDAIVVKALVAGVQPTSIDIALSREMLTISGTREDEREVNEENYFQRELYWGSFSRTIFLPEEVDVDMAEASEKHGILMIRLPKINKARQTKLKVRSR